MWRNLCLALNCYFFIEALQNFSTVCESLYMQLCAVQSILRQTTGNIFKWQSYGINYPMHYFLFIFGLADVSGRGQTWLESNLLLLVFRFLLSVIMNKMTLHIVHLWVWIPKHYSLLDLPYFQLCYEGLEKLWFHSTCTLICSTEILETRWTRLVKTERKKMWRIWKRVWNAAGMTQHLHTLQHYREGCHGNVCNEYFPHFPSSVPSLYFPLLSPPPPHWQKCLKEWCLQICLVVQLLCVEWD